MNKQATRQEMRAYVCGQCHVEYYFKGPEKRLVYPWAKGLKVEEILAYYDEAQFKDWTHAETGAPVLKAQHPEFEMWNQGIHARSGVACADCHMPYKREGALKISDHHVRSPLLNINRACQTCHKWPEEELQGAGGDDPGAHLQPAQPGDGRAGGADRRPQGGEGGGQDRRGARGGAGLPAQGAVLSGFRRGGELHGFHAPQEAARILGESIDFSRKGQIALRDGKLSSSASAAGKSSRSRHNRIHELCVRQKKLSRGFRRMEGAPIGAT